jgi:gamma-glutamyl-gamma-aminobutyrate hydrolase PuuD
MKAKPVILVLGDQLDARPFVPHGNIRFSYRDQYAITAAADADVIMFAGGNDVDPNLYGEQSGSYTALPDYHRDSIEQEVFAVALKRKIPMVGICRGAQFGCVMSGGKLFQHVTGHGLRGGHPASTSDGEEIYVTSTHHQMLNVRGTNHQLLAWASPNRSKEYLGESDNPQVPPEQEPEVVWFPNTRFLAAQYHPEYMDEATTGWKYYQKLLTKYIFNQA